MIKRFIFLHLVLKLAIHFVMLKRFKLSSHLTCRNTCGKQNKAMSVKENDFFQRARSLGKKPKTSILQHFFNICKKNRLIIWKNDLILILKVKSIHQERRIDMWHQWSVIFYNYQVWNTSVWEIRMWGNIVQTISKWIEIQKLCSSHSLPAINGRKITS